MMKDYLFLLLLLITISVSAQTTAIPDANFEQALIDLGIDSDGVINGSVLNSDIILIEDLDVGSYTINDLTGIEGFKALKVLDCYDNNLTKLNISENLNLRSLSCDENQLTSLDVTKNSLLNDLICNKNKLSSLQVDGAISLARIEASENNLTEFKAENNPALIEIVLSKNKIVSFSGAKIPSLKLLTIHENELTELDVTKNLNLSSLGCEFNNLVALDLTNNVALSGLLCSNNKLKHMDLSKNSKLGFLWIFNNNLESLNMKNGNNQNTAVTSYGNGLLKCVEVDDEVAANVPEGQYIQWRGLNGFPLWIAFAEDCNYSLSVDDETLEKGLRLYPNPVEGVLTIDSKVTLKRVEIYSTLGKRIKTISTNFTTVSLNDLPKGVYFLKIYAEKGVANKRIIKE